MCLQLLRLVAGHRKAEAELRAMAEEFCAGRRQRRSEVAPEWRQGLYQRLQVGARVKGLGSRAAAAICLWDDGTGRRQRRIEVAPEWREGLYQGVQVGVRGVRQGLWEWGHRCSVFHRWWTWIWGASNSACTRWA